MANEGQLLEEHITTPPGVNDIATIVKNLQAGVQALRSENDTLRAELSMVKSSAMIVPP